MTILLHECGETNRLGRQLNCFLRGDNERFVEVENIGSLRKGIRADDRQLERHNLNDDLTNVDLP